ncbi:glycosyltransferase family 39 protein [Ravibacter arvi]
MRTSFSSSRSLFLLIGIMLLGTFLRFYRLDTFSIFFDEKSSMVVSQGIVLEGANQKDVFSKPSFTPADFWKPKSLADYYEAMTRSDIGNSPFYYLALHLWMDVFGLSDFSARSLSAVFSVLIILLTYHFARKYFSEKTALIAAFIVAIEPFFIAYSHQARNYSLTFYLTLLSTYYLLRIVENENQGKRSYGDYAGYIAASFLCPLTHFLTVSVFLGHGLYALFFLKAKSWLRLALAGLIAISGLAWWLTLGGGQWTLHTLDYQAKEYKRVAETMPYNNPYGTVLPATPANVAAKSIPIFSDLLIFTNGLSEALVGKKNLIVAFLAGLVLIFLYHSRVMHTLSLRLRSLILAAVAFAPILFYSRNKLQFVVFSVAMLIITLFPAVHKRAGQQEKKRLWLLYIMALVPTFFLIAFAFKSGHTFGLTQRYSGFSFPYVIIFLALLAQYIYTLKADFKSLIAVVMLVQLGFVTLRLREFFQDRSLKYGYFSEPRPRNPYYLAAQKIKNHYQPGDTVFYGAPRIQPFNEMGRTFFSHSVQDAQLTNLYLPKDAAFIQVLDTIRTNKIILRQKGKDIELADLTNLRF